MCSNFFGILFSPPDLVVGCMVEVGATVSGGTAFVSSTFCGRVVWGREA